MPSMHVEPLSPIDDEAVPRFRRDGDLCLRGRIEAERFRSFSDPALRITN